MRSKKLNYKRRRKSSKIKGGAGGWFSSLFKGKGSAAPRSNNRRNNNRRNNASRNTPQAISRTASEIASEFVILQDALGRVRNNQVRTIQAQANNLRERLELLSQKAEQLSNNSLKGRFVKKVRTENTNANRFNNAPNNTTNPNPYEAPMGP